MTDVFINQREIMVNALQRSGHHAFIVWMLENCPRHLFLNCVQDDRFLRPRFVSQRPELRFVNDLDLSIEREDAGDLTPKELIAYNTEGFLIADALSIFRSPAKAGRIGRSRSAFFTVLLRDPFNNLASLATRSRGNSDKLETKVALWLDHFEAFKKGATGATETVPVLYNRWLRDEAYKRQLAERFGITAGEGPSEIVQWGGGSSFGDTRIDASEIELRWQRVKDLPVYRNLFRDEAFRAAIVAFKEYYWSPELAAAYDELMK